MSFIRGMKDKIRLSEWVKMSFIQTMKDKTQ